MVMEIKTLQERILMFEKVHNLESTPEMRLIDVLSELGEAAKEIVKSSNYGKEKLRLDRDTWEMELGDVFYSVVALANATGTDLEKALNLTMRKMEARIAMKGHPGSG